MCLKKFSNAGVIQFYSRYFKTEINMTFKLFSKHKKATNGGVMPEHEWVDAIQQIQPTNYEELIIKLKQTYPNHQLKKTYNPASKSIEEVSIQEAPILMHDTAQNIKNLVGSKWLVRGDTNKQEISISKSIKK